jgi:hypothetical protein
MKKGQKMNMLFFITYIAISTSCKKTEIPVTPVPQTDVVEQLSSETSSLNTDAIPANAAIYDVGTGSGDLVIDGNSMKIASNVFVRIKAGTYNTISVKNILASNGSTVFIKNNGLVKITQSMAIDNIANVVISGDNTPGLVYGFKFENISYRAITINKRISGITLRNMSFKNVKDYVIAGESSNGNGLNYKGTAETRNEKFKILNCLFDNVQTITFGGNLNRDSGEDSGFFKDVEIAYNTFQNTNTGVVCSFTNVQDYNIHNNVVNNINQQNNNHNGVFSMQGNGKFHDNKLMNYQGNAIRMWLYSRGTTPATNEIYNNICFNTRKYGGFELQAFERNMVQGKTTFANAKVYNNTVGQMNTSKDWEGQILDLYNTGGTLEFYNNLGFNLVALKSITNMINNMSDTKIVKQVNNKYLTHQQDAVSNVTGFVSKVTGVGASLK